MSTTKKLLSLAKPPAKDVVVSYQFAKNEECVLFLRDMLARAERGEVIGGASTWMLKSREFEMHMTGEASRSPVYTIGMLSVFIEKLQRQVLGR